MGFTKESLWALRREVVLNSLFIADYHNNRHIDPRVVCDFFDGFLEDVEARMEEDIPGFNDVHFFDHLPKYDNGSEIKYTMLSPKHIEHTEYIECWLYDDYHREPHKFYSHLKPGSMKKENLITSIKLTAGRQIKHVTDIWLTAFICASLDDFDDERNYIGETSCTIHILKEE